jgi:beta-phosphoglucomutase-like phosphatase (HAD superfamily)
MPGATDVVARLAARVPVAVASNGPRELLDTSLAHGDLSR